MRWMTRWGRVLALAGVMLAGAGCATTAMKGTPFFTGEYARSRGPVEDRVNLWPVMYYRAPALSAVWPLIEYVESEHFAVRPLFSVYDLGDAGGREWNVLWPIFQVDQAQDNGRLFPVLWWGKGYFDVFPLYWHHRDQAGVVDLLIPLWLYGRESHETRFLAAAGLIGWVKEDDGTSRWAFPLWGDLRRGREGYSRYQLFPIFHQYRSPDGLARRHQVFPLWYWDRTPHEQTLLTPLWWQGRDPDGAWKVLLPFFYYASGTHQRGFYTLLGGGSRDDNGDASWVVPPLLSWGRCGTDGDNAWYLAGLGRRQRNAEGRASHVIPFYARRADAQGSRFYSLPWSQAREADGDGWSLLPPLYFNRREGDRSLVLSPLYGAGRDAGEERSWSWLFPLYYKESNREGRLFATLLGGRETFRDGEALTLYPLLSRGGTRNGVHDWWLLAPLAHFRWGDQHSRSHVIPLFYNDTADGTLVTPAYARWASGETRLQLAPPLLSWRATSADGVRDDWWLLGGLAHFTAGTERGSSHVFPLYYCGADGLRLSPLYLGRQAEDDGWFAIPPLLSGYRRDGDRRTAWSLLGLYQHGWSTAPDGRTRDMLLPLYAYEANRHFYTPLFGWDADGDAYYLTPVLGSHAGPQGGSCWLFPILHRKWNTDGTRTSTRILWGGWTRGPREVDTGFFPLYSYERQEYEYQEEEGKPRSRCQRVDFLCAPICWYDRSTTRQAEERAPGPGTVLRESRGHGVFPLWRYRRSENRGVTSTLAIQSGPSSAPLLDQPSARGGAARTTEFDFLLRLYDYRHEVRAPGEETAQAHDYTRRRVLWKLWHYEKLNGDVSSDAFPFYTYDARRDGFRQHSFLWRFYRWQKSPEGKRKLDLLFIPLLRE